MKKKVKVVRPFGGVCAVDFGASSVVVVARAHPTFFEQEPYRYRALSLVIETDSAREGFRL
jgi:hypothetical protein